MPLVLAMVETTHQRPCNSPQVGTLEELKDVDFDGVIKEAEACARAVPRGGVVKLMFFGSDFWG